MTRIALLIGVTQDTDASSQAKVGVQQNIEAMQRVLQHRDMGRFEVKTLTNPDQASMEQGIEALFANCQKYDLVLLYFCGLALKNARGDLHLTAAKSGSTRQETGTLGALAASFVQAMSAKSPSERQVVILDCCLNQVAGELGDNNPAVNAAAQLVREGQAALAAFTPSQCFYSQNRPQPSVYTRYLVEGMETGAADLDNDGVVSVDELYEYTSRKVQKVAPEIESVIYWVREDANKLVLAKAATGDPKLSYRKQVERFAWAGESAENRRTLDALRERLNLPPEEASAIEARVLQPDQEYRQSSKHHSPKPKLRESLQHSTLANLGELAGLKETNTPPLEAIRQKELFPFLSRVTRSSAIVLPNKAVKPSDPVVGRAVRPASARLWETNPAIRQPRNLRLLIGTAIAAILMLIALVSRLSFFRPTPPTRPETPDQQINPEATIPIPPAVRPLPLPTLPPPVQLPTEPPIPTAIPETPAFSKPDLPLVVPQARPTSASPTPFSPPKVATPKPRPTSAPQPVVPGAPPPLQVKPSPASGPTPTLVEPEAPPTSQIEAPPSSEPGATLSDPETPPEPEFESPPTSAPEPN